MSNLLSQASLVMIPSGYKEDTVYSQIPTNGNGDLSFTRASNGTRINSAGLVEVCPWNLVGYSEEFSNAYWTKNNSPVMSYNVATAPNGTMTADSIQSNSSSVYQSVGASSVSVAPNSTFTLSLYIKKETSKTYFTGSYLYFTGGTTKLTYVLFDEVNGTINIIAPDQVSMVTSVESVGDWWRFIVTGTDTGSNTQLDFAFYGTLSQNGTSLSPGIGSARRIWGAQLNIGSTAKPYFPTTDRLNVPRLTYQNGGGGCPSLLLEKQSTNLELWSQDLTNAVYLDGGGAGFSITRTANYGISPDGTQNATRLQIVRGSSYAELYQRVSTTIGVTYTFSFYGKSLNGTPTLSTFWDNSYVNEVTFTTNWVRYTYTFVATSTSSGINLVTWTSLTNTSATADILVWGVQLEASSYPTSYIPTTSASATRVADACFKSTSLLANQTIACLFLDVVINQQPDNYAGIMEFRNGTTCDFYMLQYQASNTIEFRARGSNGVENTVVVSPALGRKKIAMYRNGDNLKVFINGVKEADQTSATAMSAFANSAQTFYYNFDPAFGTYSNCININESIIFAGNALTDAELISLTTI